MSNYTRPLADAPFHCVLCEFAAGQPVREVFRAQDLEELRLQMRKIQTRTYAVVDQSADDLGRNVFRSANEGRQRICFHGGGDGVAGLVDEGLGVSSNL